MCRGEGAVFPFCGCGRLLGSEAENWELFLPLARRFR